MDDTDSDREDELGLNPEFLRSLILQLRAYMAQAGTVTEDPGSNPTDDDASPLSLQDGPGNPLRAELTTRIADLEPDQQAQLVALMWIGRGDMEPEEWADAVKLAEERRTGPTARYLLSHPQVADDIEEGIDKLFDGTDLMDTGEY
jgi:hypothetical protein